jgi:hypothetical protein
MNTCSLKTGNPLDSTGLCLDPNEYLLIENRQPIGFDGLVPQGGLSILHIDDNAGYNTQGFPGQSGWPANGNHYRPLQNCGHASRRSMYHLEKDANRADSRDVFHGGTGGVNALLPTGVTGFAHPNTNGTKGGESRRRPTELRLSVFRGRTCRLLLAMTTHRDLLLQVLLPRVCRRLRQRVRQQKGLLESQLKSLIESPLNSPLNSPLDGPLESLLESQR